MAANAVYGLFLLVYRMQYLKCGAAAAAAAAGVVVCKAAALALAAML